MLQNLAWSVSLILIAIIVGVFVWTVRHSHLNEVHPDASISAAKWRSRIFWTLSILFVPIIAYSLTEMPYAPNTMGRGDAIVIQATGYQWRWELSQDTVPVGKPVEFHVTSADVNHGFSIYDANLRLHTQTQAMPGITNVLRYTFSTPGTYRVLCLEYCGMAHHNMMAEIKVVAEQQIQ